MADTTTTDNHSTDQNNNNDKNKSPDKIHENGIKTEINQNCKLKSINELVELVHLMNYSFTHLLICFCFTTKSS